MRISDWSSDVCSSDLRIVPRRHHADHADRLVPHLRAGRPQPPAAADAPRLHPAEQLAAQVVDLGADGHRVGEQGLVGGTMAEVGADGGEHRKSEEHTSELQSQMRIAYDVVRLEQKKTSNNLAHLTCPEDDSVHNLLRLAAELVEDH